MCKGVKDCENNANLVSVYQIGYFFAYSLLSCQGIQYKLIKKYFRENVFAKKHMAMAVRSLPCLITM